MGNTLLTERDGALVVLTLNRPDKLNALNAELLSELDVSLAANGFPVKVVVVTGSGNKALDDAAVAAVREWKFRPATVRGRPTTSRLQVPIRFTPPNPPPDECNQYL